VKYLNFRPHRIHCTNFDSEFIIYPLAVGVFVVMAVLYGKVCYRLRETSIIDGGRFMRRQYRGIRTSITVLFAFLVASIFEFSNF